MMQPMSQASQKILEKIFHGMEPGTSKKYGEKGGTYMQLCAERLTEKTYSMAHYYEQNGDLVPDPDMMFVVYGGRWYPVECTQGMFYTSCVSLDANEKPMTYKPGPYRSVKSLANMWLRNVKAQQKL